MLSNNTIFHSRFYCQHLFSIPQALSSSCASGHQHKNVLSPKLLLRSTSCLTDHLLWKRKSDPVLSKNTHTVKCTSGSKVKLLILHFASVDGVLICSWSRIRKYCCNTSKSLLNLGIFMPSVKIKNLEIFSSDISCILK